MQMNVKSIQRTVQSYADALPSGSDLRRRLPEWDDVRERLPELPDVDDRAVAKGLGWVSVAIGLAEILMPRRIEKTMGLHDGQTTGILRVLGVREICHGIDILSHRDPAPGIRSRVAGDLLDGALLAVAATKSRRPGGFLAICAMALPVVVLDLIYARKCADRECEE